MFFLPGSFLDTSCCKRTNLMPEGLLVLVVLGGQPQVGAELGVAL